MTATVTVELLNPLGSTPFTLDDATYGLLDSGNLIESGNVWTSFTATGVSIARGRDRALDQQRAGTISVRLWDFDRTFDPENQLGTFYGSLTPGRKIRVFVDDILLVTGRVVDFDATHSLGDFVEVVITATDQVGIVGGTSVTSHTPSSQATGTRIAALLARSEVNFGAALDIDTGHYTCGTETISGGTLGLISSAVAGEHGLLLPTRGGSLDFWGATAFDSLLPVAHSVTDCTWSAVIDHGGYATTYASGAEPLGDIEWLFDVRIESWSPYYGFYLATGSCYSLYLMDDWGLGIGTAGTWYAVGDVNGSTVYAALPADLVSAIAANDRIRFRYQFDTTDGSVSRWKFWYSLPTEHPADDLTEEAWYLIGDAPYGSVLSPSGTGQGVTFGGNVLSPTRSKWYRAILRDNLTGSPQTPVFDWQPEYGGRCTDRITGDAVTLSTNASCADEFDADRTSYSGLDFSFGGDELYTRVEVTPTNLAMQAVQDGDVGAQYGGQRTLAFDVPLSTTTAGAEIAAIVLSKYADPGLRYRSLQVQLAGRTAGQRQALMQLDIGSVVRVCRTLTATGEPSQTIRTCIVEGIRHELSASTTSHLMTLSVSELDGYMSSEFRAWEDYTPTITNVTSTGATVTGKYKKIGRMVHWYVTWVYGSGSAVSGLIGVSLPFTASRTRQAPISGYLIEAGGGSIYNVIGAMESTTRVDLYVQSIATHVGTVYPVAAATSGSVPFTWNASDLFLVGGVYEAAAA